MIDIDYILARVREEDIIAISRETSDPPDLIREDRINTAISDAASLVVEKWSDKYDYPWCFEECYGASQAEDRLKRIHFDLAIYFLYALKYDDEEMKDVKDRFDKAIDMLDSFSSEPLNKKPEKHFPYLILRNDYFTGIQLDSFITNKTEEDIKLHGIFEVNS
jgi:hypothetical protein